MLRLATTFELLAAALERLTVRYAVVGSVASSAHGSYRATEDIDVVASILPGQGAELVQALGKDWYADAEQIRDSTVAGRAFNVIYIRWLSRRWEPMRCTRWPPRRISSWRNCNGIKRAVKHRRGSGRTSQR